jgi:hypothetical protein
MKFYGVGCLFAPRTKRVVHDFEDGPFETVNPEMIEAAIKQGFSKKPLEKEVRKLDKSSTVYPTSKGKGGNK